MPEHKKELGCGGILCELLTLLDQRFFSEVFG
jgi:hypothetical protein